MAVTTTTKRQKSVSRGAVICLFQLTDDDEQLLLSDLVEVRLCTSDVGRRQIQVGADVRQHVVGGLLHERRDLQGHRVDQRVERSEILRQVHLLDGRGGIGG